MKKIVIAVIVLVLGAAGFWYLSGGGEDGPGAARTMPAPPEEGEAAPSAADIAAAEAAGESADGSADPYADWQGDGAAEPEQVRVVAPDSLDGSDQRFVAAVADLSGTAAKWFVPKEQVRKWVVAIDQLAEGDVPTRNRPVTVARARFEAKRRGESDIWVPKDANYQRLNGLVQTVTAIEPERLAAYYRDWLPLFERGYEELGKRGDFDRRMKLAIARIQAVKPLAEPVELKRPGAMYVYADSELEAAPDIDKLMWRLGPENLATIQAYLERLEPLL